MMAEVTNLGKWIMYCNSSQPFGYGDYYGEWLVFFSRQHYDYVRDVCIRAVNSGAVRWCKHSSMSSIDERGSGVAAFKLDDSDWQQRDGCFVSHSNAMLLIFLRDNNMLRKTKKGRYANIRYKLALDGKGPHTGNDWKGFSLSDFMDLDTGEVYAEQRRPYVR